MRRSAVSIKDYDLTVEQFQARAFFDVEERAAYYRHDDVLYEIPNKKTLIRSDTGTYLSTVGRNFMPITNENYFNSVINTLGDAGVEYTPKQCWVEDNGTTNMIVDLPQFSMFRGTEEEQTGEARFSNRFDATAKATNVLGGRRLVCTNGMTAFFQDFQFNISHKGDVEQKIKDAVELYMDIDNVFKRTEDKIVSLSETNADKDKVAAYIGNGEITGQSMLTGERWAGRLRSEWSAANEPVNLWLLYNMFTEIFSHRYGSNYSSKQQKQNHLNREVAAWNRILI